MSKSAGGSEREPPDNKLVAKIAVTGIAAIGAGVSTIIVGGGGAGIEDSTIQYGLTVFGVVASIALLVCAFHLWLNGAHSARRHGKDKERAMGPVGEKGDGGAVTIHQRAGHDSRSGSMPS